MTALRAQLRQVAATARQVAAAAPHLADDVAAARAQVDRLAAGLDQLATGADRLHQGTSSASTGAPQLYGGLYRLSTGARQLDGGLAALSDGTHRLASGLSTLQVGATRLADGLADGARKIPGYDPDDRARRADVLGDPVSLDRTVHHKAATYGVGFAPYFLSLALWVGAMMNTRGLMELVVINVGYELGIIPRSMFCILVLMAVVTTLMTGPLLHLFRKNTEIESLMEQSRQ